MNNRQRFHATMNFERVDRLPMIEWATWWDKTIDRWKQEGLPNNLTNEGEIREYFGLDRVRQCWLRPFKSTYDTYGKDLISDINSYNKIKKHLYPEIPRDALASNTFDRKKIEDWAKSDTIIWITLEGFFWFPRTLFGIEEHFYAFYDKPELMHAMNQDLLGYNLRVLDQFCEICKPDFMTFAEDMSYNYGSMISKTLFDEFMKPYYQQIVPKLKEYGIIPFIDTDGNIEGLISWFTDIGIEGFLPLERQAGVDIVKLRRIYPQLKVIGGYDKIKLNQI